MASSQSLLFTEEGRYHDASNILGYTVLTFGLLITLSYLGISLQPAFLNLNGKTPTFTNKTNIESDELRRRCIVKHMNEANKNLVIFFGSQTGNAQDFAEKLAKEGAARFGLGTIVADLEDYDYETLSKFTEDKIAIFVLSSYGEGEPTDNAVRFYEFITEQSPLFSADADVQAPLRGLTYAAFGLGNSTYEHYNAVVRRVSAALQEHGAHLVGQVGEGDDAQGTTEDSFITWKESLWEVLIQKMQLEERESKFKPSFTVVELQSPESRVYLGERSNGELHGMNQFREGSKGYSNPPIVKLLRSEELFQSQDRNCLHLEFDLENTGLTYHTGDHASIWPINPDAEVDRFLRVFGLLEKRHTSFSILPTESTIHVPLPSPTTYDAAARYYLEIAGPVSRQSLAILAEFGRDDQQKKALLRLAKDQNHFQKVVSSQLLNLAELIEFISPSNTTYPVPFSVLLECTRALQPRQYSISSSSMVQKSSLSCTIVVDSVRFEKRDFKGIASNYLLALKNHQNHKAAGDYNSTHALSGPREKYQLSLAMQIRHSTFRLPTDTTQPIVMIGPGTGVAPFRAFVHERAAQFKLGHSVGPSLLFFGCRRASEDFIYRNEWEDLSKVLSDSFKMYTAFSRETDTKVYVQHVLVQHAAEVYSLLVKQNGHLYICGDARMARDVHQTLRSLLSQQSQISLPDVDIILKSMRSSGRLQEDVW